LAYTKKANKSPDRINPVVLRICFNVCMISSF
jgi:hypothetical protein